MRTRALIVDDHQLFADALRLHLEDEGFEVVDVAKTGRDALHAVRTKRPGVVLLDLGLPDTDGAEIGRQILELDPEVKIVVVSAREDPDAVRQALHDGFRGYLTKDSPLRRFVGVIEQVLDGQIVIPSRASRAVRGPRSEEERHAALCARLLTSREHQILRFLVEGAGNAEIAHRLSVSPHTARTHVQNILTKLGVKSRLEAAAFAVRYGIVKPVRSSD